MLSYAEGKSRLNSQTEREGVVVRSMDNKVSFKAISNNFLLKEKIMSHINNFEQIVKLLSFDDSDTFLPSSDLKEKKGKSRAWV